MMEEKELLKLVATDLDGTFLMNDTSISRSNMEMLEVLGEKGIIRVVATGRNFRKTCEVIPDHIPFDYVVFSSGAGVYDWKKRELMYFRNMHRDTVSGLVRFFINRDLNFHLFKPVPDNHMCWYYRGTQPCSEFERYFDFHNSYSEPLPENCPPGSEACQFLVIFPNNPKRFHELKHEILTHFPEVKVVRTSSPLDTGYIWMEIFHEAVSKGNGVKFVCDAVCVDHNQTLGIGNDFNDLDLLEFTRYSYVVENGPDELKARFRVAKSNEEDAFAHAVKDFL